MIELILGVFIYFNFFYQIAIFKKDFGVVDIGWGGSFIVIFLIGQMNSSLIPSLRVLLVGGLILIWATRLSLYIFIRSRKIDQEDFRYAQWRGEWGTKANFYAYFKVFMLQGLISLILGYPLYLISFSTNQIAFGSKLDILGLTIWMIGFLFETIGDHQKHIHKSNPLNKNKILSTGLWKYTRHPNYFGESLLWWGMFLILVNDIPVYIAVITPILLTFLLIKVSGITMLEKKYIANPDYKKYKEKTNSFLPWFSN